MPIVNGKASCWAIQWGNCGERGSQWIVTLWCTFGLARNFTAAVDDFGNLVSTGEQTS